MQSGTKLVFLYGAGAALFGLGLVVLVAVGFSNAFVVVFTDLAVAIGEEPQPEAPPKRAAVESSPDPHAEAHARLRERAHQRSKRAAAKESNWLEISWQLVKWLNVRPYF